tara:strand:- start:9 stop:542 length:534 start_codon:yes stop_codon:yes gene_type:complete
MKHLNGMVKEFKKTAMESNALNQRLTALYEDMGSVLNRYYDINEHDDGLTERTPSEVDKDQKAMIQQMKNKKKNAKSMEKVMANEELKSSDIGSGDNKLSKDAAKSDEKLNKDDKYKYAEGYTMDTAKDIEDVEAKRAKTARYKKKTASMYNEDKKSIFSMPSLVSLAPSSVTKVKK